MADFARWGEALGRALGWGAGAFAPMYRLNIHQATEPALEDSQVGTALLEMGWQLAMFRGSPAELLREVTFHVDCRDIEDHRHLSAAIATTRCVANSPQWPKTTRQFSKELHRVLPMLRQHGINAEFTRGNKGCQIAFACTKPPSSGAEDG